MRPSRSPGGRPSPSKGLAGGWPEEHVRDECGVFGLYAPGHEVSRLSYFALYALQHRGQESAGIAAADRGGHIITRRELGLVNQVFTENDLSTLAGELAIGHVRYSTTGSNAWENSQPVQRSVGTRGSQREVALAHNGNLINAVELHNELLAQGVTFSSTSDSEIIAALIATHPAEHVEDVIAAVLPRLKGAFSTVVMTKDRVVAFRDPHGLRPLSLGVLEPALTPPDTPLTPGTPTTLASPANDPNGEVSASPHHGQVSTGGTGMPEDGQLRYCVASESCALDIIGAKFLRDVQPGEVVTLSEQGCSSKQVVEGAR